MIKADIVKIIAQEMNLGDRDALGIVDHIIDAVKAVVVQHERLEIRDFGVFQVKQRKPRIGRNPRNKKEYPIAPHRVVTFKAGKNLRARAEGQPVDLPIPSPRRRGRKPKAAAEPVMLEGAHPEPAVAEPLATPAGKPRKRPAPTEPPVPVATPENNAVLLEEEALKSSINSDQHEDAQNSEAKPQHPSAAAKSDGKKKPESEAGEQLTMDAFFSFDTQAAGAGDD